MKKTTMNKGQGMTEYIVILGVIVALLIVFRGQFMPSIQSAVQSLTGQVNSAINP